MAFTTEQVLTAAEAVYWEIVELSVDTDRPCRAFGDASDLFGIDANEIVLDHASQTAPELAGPDYWAFVDAVIAKVDADLGVADPADEHV